MSDKIFIEDELEVDPEYPTARYVGISFLSPEKILKKREIFLFEKFVQSWDFVESMKKYSDFMHFISEKFGIKIEILQKDFQDYIKEEEDQLRSESVLEKYKSFLELNEDKLMDVFNRENQFQTSVRGIKIRTPTKRTPEEVEMLVKKIRERDPKHDIYIGEVGKWMPLDPDAYKTGRVEFMEKELNELHHAKTINEENAKLEFDKRVAETKRKAIIETAEKANKTGNKTTQVIDETGKLIGVKEKIDLEDREVATEEMKENNRKELLERNRNNNKPDMEFNM